MRTFCNCVSAHLYQEFEMKLLYILRDGLSIYGKECHNSPNLLHYLNVTPNTFNSSLALLLILIFKWTFKDLFFFLFFKRRIFCTVNSNLLTVCAQDSMRLQATSKAVSFLGVVRKKKNTELFTLLPQKRGLIAPR